MADHSFKRWRITEQMLKGLELYLHQGLVPGKFLAAVICNDLVKAVAYADPQNMANLPAFADYLYNEMPGGAWGSQDKMLAWAGAQEKAFTDEKTKRP